jgi:tRNA(Ile)-lysidine synthetase-like protein
MAAHSLPDGRLLIAVSGGPDSTALLLALHEAGRELVAAHYDHALRDGSEEVARQVAELCARIVVPLISERRSEAMPKGSVQAAARKLRYEFLDRARVQAHADAVVLAHTADDLVEGTVLHLLRGCGIAGFRGMPARRGHYVRPWLGVWRSEVREFLGLREVAVHEDPANEDTRFARVRVRLEILPALERDRPGISKRFHGAALAAARLQVAAEEEAKGEVTRRRLQSMSQPAAAEAMRLLYVNAGGSEPGLARSHIESMLSLTRPGRGGRGVDLPGGLRFRIVGDLVQVVPSQAHAEMPRRPEPQLVVSRCLGCDESQAAHLREGVPLHLGHRRPGLRIRPQGGRGSRKLQDIFVDARVPREERDAWPLVFAGEKLAWVPGLAVDADAASRPGEEALHVTVAPMPVHSHTKVVRLENPESPPGVLS